MITINSQQARFLRLAVLSLGSGAILYLLFALSTSVASSGSHAASPWGETAPQIGGSSSKWPAWVPSTGSSSGSGGGGGGGGSSSSGGGGGSTSSSSSTGSALLEGNIIGDIQYDDELGRFRYSDDHPWLEGGGRQRRRILAGSAFGAHEDVYVSLLNSLRTFTDSIRIYTPGFRWGFADVVKDLGMYDGKYYDAVQIVQDLGRKNLWQGEDAGKKADMVILGTCEVDMEAFSADLWKQWQARDADDKFVLVCVVHNAFATGWLMEYGQDWVKAGALRLAPISAHVKRAFLYSLDTYADTPPLHKVGFDSVPIHVHVPLLPLKLPERTTPQKAMLTNAVIQGNFDANRRDYAGVFGDLLAELKLDPKPWGYHRVGADPEFVPNPTAEITPFVLHLAGNGDITIPAELANVVRVHRNLAYDDFFRIMHSMDVALLAFTPASSEETKGGYYEVQASSSVAMAMMCEVPLLTTYHIQKTYTYTRSPLVSITRPAFFREVEAVKLLRAGEWVHGADADADGTDAADDEDGAGAAAEVIPPGVEQQAQRMIDGGWKRSDEGWKEWRATVDHENLQVARRLLMGW